MRVRLKVPRSDAEAAVATWWILGHGLQFGQQHLREYAALEARTVRESRSLGSHASCEMYFSPGQPLPLLLVQIKGETPMALDSRCTEHLLLFTSNQQFLSCKAALFWILHLAVCRYRQYSRFLTGSTSSPRNRAKPLGLVV